MGLNIGVDPGVNTGLAVWNNGKLLETLTVHMPQKVKPKTKKRPAIVLSDSERLIELERKLDAVFFRLHGSWLGADVPIDTVAIETFGNHNSQFGASRMLLCGQARAVGVLVANKYSRHVIDVTKGNRPKTEAEWFAKQYGVSLEKAKEHERDALHLSIIAGFDRRSA